MHTARSYAAYAPGAPLPPLAPFARARREPDPHDVDLTIDFRGVCPSGASTPRPRAYPVR